MPQNNARFTGLSRRVGERSVRSSTWDGQITGLNRSPGDRRGAKRPGGSKGREV